MTEIVCSAPKHVFVGIFPAFRVACTGDTLEHSQPRCLSDILGRDFGEVSPLPAGIDAGDLALEVDGSLISSGLTATIFPGGFFLLMLGRNDGSAMRECSKKVQRRQGTSRYAGHDCGQDPILQRALLLWRHCH